MVAQDELSLTHEFAEFLLSSSRDQLSSYINRMIGELIQSFLDSYVEMKEIADTTDEVFQNLESGFCAERWINRWNLQRLRFGNRLSECLAVSHNVMNRFSTELNALHTIGQRTSNQVQNVGMHILSQIDSFHTRQDFERLINRQLRILLTLVRPYQTIYDNYVDNVATTSAQTISELTDCERSLLIAFRIEAEDDIAGANACFSD